jgi:hypothetical protein
VFAHGMSGFLKERFSECSTASPLVLPPIVEVNAERKQYRCPSCPNNVDFRRRHSIRLQTDESRRPWRRLGTKIDACRRPILCELQRLY